MGKDDVTEMKTPLKDLLERKCQVVNFALFSFEMFSIDKVIIESYDYNKILIVSRKNTTIISNTALFWKIREKLRYVITHVTS